VRVRSGDTLSEIAARHGVSVSDLRRWNALGSSRIVIGQTLRLTAPASGSATYRVRRGDTLDEIARRYGVSVSEIKAWNGLTSSRIDAGQTLTVKHGEGPMVHVVQRGDTLGTIAQSYDTSITTLRRLNGLHGSRIYIGQKLRIRSGS
jgi:membrane-bound lytic murein transglycosylase D